MDRLHEIILFLLKQEAAITYKFLAKQMHVSVASIRNDIKVIESLLTPYGIRLMKQRGIGISLLGDLQARTSLYREYSGGTTPRKGNEHRINDLLYYLVENKECYFTIDHLADLLFVSRTTVQHDLNELKEQMAAQGIHLDIKQKKGVRLLGSEKALRTIYAKAFHDQLDRSQLPSSYSIQNRIMELIHIDSNPILQALKILEQHCGYVFTQDSFQIIVIHIAIAIKRIQEEKSVNWDSQMHIAEHEQEYLETIALCDSLESSYHIKISTSERYVILLYIISGRINTVSQQQQVYDKDRIYQIAEELIALVENVKQMDIDSVAYLPALITHLRPMINRIVNDIHLENPLMEDIKREYSDAYGIAWMANGIFKRYLNQGIEEDEVGFLAIHIQIMIESQKEAYRIIIICNNGIGISQLLSSRLKSYFPQLHILKTLSLEEFYRFHEEQSADLILSTIPVETSRPLLMVSPLLSEADLQAINQYMEHKPTPEAPLRNDLEIQVYLHPSLNSMKDVINLIYQEAMQKGNVKDDFRQTLLAREKMSSTAIGNQTAIPHASFVSVLRSFLAIITLDHPILWGSDEVDLIVCIALTKQDAVLLKKKLRALFYQLYSQETHLRLINAEHEAEILCLLTI